MYVRYFRHGWSNVHAPYDLMYRYPYYACVCVCTFTRLYLSAVFSTTHPLQKCEYSGPESLSHLPSPRQVTRAKVSAPFHPRDARRDWEKTHDISRPSPPLKFTLRQMSIAQSKSLDPSKRAGRITESPLITSDVRGVSPPPMQSLASQVVIEKREKAKRRGGQGEAARDYVMPKTPASQPASQLTNATSTKKPAPRFFFDSNNCWHPRGTRSLNEKVTPIRSLVHPLPALFAAATTLRFLILRLLTIRYRSLCLFPCPSLSFVGCQSPINMLL